jgi:hypothetical protein
MGDPLIVDNNVGKIMSQGEGLLSDGKENE